MSILHQIDSNTFESESVLELIRESVTDGIVNQVFQSVSGWGEIGEIVYGERPSRRFKSGFLLPRYNERNEDDTSFIHISNHGIDFQINRNSTGNIQVVPRFSSETPSTVWSPLLSSPASAFMVT